jgi:hypothetical protein
MIRAPRYLTDDPDDDDDLDPDDDGIVDKAPDDEEAEIEAVKEMERVSR